MTRSKDYETVFQRYHETEAKFDYFVVGSTLAILAFSIQHPKDANYAGWIIVGSWTSFLLSFLAGLWRLESLVVIRKGEVELAEDTQQKPSDWWTEHRRKLSMSAFWAYRFQKTLLVLGLTAYALFHILNFLNH